jgi:hypothetical protein
VQPVTLERDGRLKWGYDISKLTPDVQSALCDGMGNIISDTYASVSSYNKLLTGETRVGHAKSIGGEVIIGNRVSDVKFHFPGVVPSGFYLFEATLKSASAGEYDLFLNNNVAGVVALHSEWNASSVVEYMGNFICVTFGANDTGVDMTISAENVNIGYADIRKI